VVRHVGIACDYVRVDLGRGEHRRPDYLALNPNGKVPTLVDDGVVLWEAAAIAFHLARKVGDPLWPSDVARQAEVMRWLSWELAHFSRAAGGLYFERVIKPWIGAEADPAAIEESTASFHAHAATLDDHLRERIYLLGDELTLADLFVARMLPYADEARLPLDAYPALARWNERLMALPAWRDPWPTA
ncbi:MAG TPA: glutathione S-transferase family protein, partial [Dokdonella sp.]|nr:glutathione S-transferase family protein [Dokdonella sp.]